MLACHFDRARSYKLIADAFDLAERGQTGQQPATYNPGGAG
jgi:hypothetical protein